MLRLTVRTNAYQLARRLKQRPQSVQQELEAVARHQAERHERQAREILEEKVYSRPIPRGKRSGKPQWERSRDLINREKAKADGINLVMRNTSGHAVYRRNLGTPKGRPIRSPGILRVDWQQEARDALRTELLQARRAGVLRALRR